MGTTDTQITAFVGGRLIDGTGAEPVADAVVLIAGDKVQQAGPASQAWCRGR